MRALWRRGHANTTDNANSGISSHAREALALNKKEIIRKALKAKDSIDWHHTTTQ